MLNLSDGGPRISEWLPDETLFSLCSRFDTLYGHPKPGFTCQALFGHIRHGSSHDFPVRVDEFSHRTFGVFGESRQVILEHTILPFYLQLPPKAVASDAIATARSTSLGNLKAKLGLLSSRFGASHPLKSCPSCMLDDQSNHHVSYWHLMHQWPGMWVCPKHNTPLLRGLEKVNTHGRFHWYLPDDMTFVEAASPEVRNICLASLTKLARCIEGFVTFDVQLNSQSLRCSYQQRLLELDMASSSGKLSLPRFSELLISGLEPLSSVYGLEVLNGKQVALCAQFQDLLRDREHRYHPLRHLLLVSAMFTSWADFLETYHRVAESRAVSDATCANGVGTRSTRGNQNQRKSELVTLLRQGVSISQAARTLGVAVATAMAWSAASGMPIPRRAKHLTSELRQLAIARLNKGAEKAGVAEAVGVSVQTITLLMRTEVGLQQAWRTARFAKAQRVARSVWERSADRQTSSSTKSLRAAQPAVYAWLYRNDRAWLMSFSENIPKAGRTRPRMRWDLRDEELSLSVRTAALGFSESHPDQFPRLSHLCDAIPLLKRRLSSLDRLPLTRRALHDVTRRPRKSN